ncbi:MAG: restriction endonuclease subunit S [Methylococcales bacterium]|nr:restriction endonuclease subunit S [Methylococcales bacterium]
MSEWVEYKLGEAPLEILDGDRGKNYPSQDEFQINGYCLFLSTKNVRFDGFDLSDCQYISKERDELLRKGKLKINDIVLTTRGTIGNIGFFDASIKIEHIRINSGMVIIRPIEDRLFPTFNYYVFRKLQNDFHTFTSGSAQPQLPIRDIKEIDISLPLLPEQKAIAAVLSSLDDKIDLLHRQNKTLEAMAETLFRQWFIEEAKEDWEEGSLDDVISVKGGTTPSTKNFEFWFGDIHWTTPRDLSGHNTVYLFDTDRKITEKGLSQIGSGLLPVGTVLLSSRAPIGYLAIIEIPLAINQGYIAIVCDKIVSNYFIYLWCKANIEEIKNSGNGSVFQEISKSTFKEMIINIPPNDLLLAFDTKVVSIFKKIKANQIQLQTLEKLRDNLLPKLMSGEVRVSYEQQDAA